MGEVSTSSYTFLQKVDSSESQVWLKFYSGNPSRYSFAFDSSMTTIYYLLNDDLKFGLILISTADGSIYNALSNSSGSVYWNSENWRIVIKNDQKAFMSLTDGTDGLIWTYSKGNSKISWYKINSLNMALSLQYVSNQKIFLTAINVSTNSIEYKLVE